MGKAKPANSAKTGQRATSGSWKKGQSGNPNGRPAEGESWAAVIKKVSSMTGEEAAVYISEFGKFSKALKGVTLKEAVAFRCFAALMFEPQASMFNAMADRAEGKVADTVKHEGAMGVVSLNADLDGKTETQVKNDLNIFASVAARLAGVMDSGAKPAEGINPAGKKKRPPNA